MRISGSLSAAIATSVNIALAAFTCLQVNNANAEEDFRNVFTIDGPLRTDSGDDLATDANGNIFLAGSHGGLDLDNDGQIDIAAQEVDQMFIKLRYRGENQAAAIEWIRSPSAVGMEHSPRIAPDRKGGALVTGRFRDELRFNDSSILTGGGGNDSFVARYAPDGSLVWKLLFGGEGGDALFDIESDRDGNAYLTGMGFGTFKLDHSGAEFAAPSDKMATIIYSLDQKGTVRWQHLFPGHALPLFVGVSPAGELFVSGEFEGEVDFDSDGRIDLPAPNRRSGFIARFSLSGELLNAWSTGGGGPSKFAFSDSGDLFAGGGLSDPSRSRYGIADFNGDGSADVEIKGGGPTGAWVARYSVDGSLRWLRSYALERFTDIKASRGRLLMTGAYHGVRDLDEDGIPEPSDNTVDPIRENELATLILFEDGRPDRVWTAPGPGNDVASAGAFSPDSAAVFVTGYIQLTADFNGDGESGDGWRSCESLGDFFFAQYWLD